MNAWLDWIVVIGAILVSIAYVAYALGPKRIRNTYTRIATKYFGLRALRWFQTSHGGHSCRDCPSHPASPPTKRV